MLPVNRTKQEREVLATQVYPLELVKKVAQEARLNHSKNFANRDAPSGLHEDLPIRVLDPAEDEAYKDLSPPERFVAV